MMRRRACALAGLILLASAERTFAQNDVSVSAEVPVASPTGGGVRNLAFGAVTITPGVTKTVSVPAAVTAQSGSVFAGEFAFNVGNTNGLDFSLALPTTLVSTVGGLSLAISFNGAQYGAHCVTEGASGCTLTSFNPATAPSTKVCKAYKGNGDCKINTPWLGGTLFHVYLGGVITVPPTQIAATYTATVTVQITQVY